MFWKRGDWVVRKSANTYELYWEGSCISRLVFYTRSARFMRKYLQEGIEAFESILERMDKK